MKGNLTIMAIIGALALSSNIFATDKEIKLENQQPSRKTQQYQIPIPVHANFDNTLLGIHFFKKVLQVFVTVTGPDGIVYQREVTSTTAKSIYIDLSQYQEGEYNIYFQDAEGNEVSGEFFKEE